MMTGFLTQENRHASYPSSPFKFAYPHFLHLNALGVCTRVDMANKAPKGTSLLSRDACGLTVQKSQFEFHVSAASWSCGQTFPTVGMSVRMHNPSKTVLQRRRHPVLCSALKHTENLPC